MARLIMISGYAVSSDVNDGGSYADSTYQMLNPRTSKPIRKFGLKQIIAWNRNGTVGGALVGFGNEEAIGAFGAIELHDTATRPTDNTTMMMKIPISAKSRIDMELPDKGLIFKHGIYIRVGEEGLNNGWVSNETQPPSGTGQKIDVQLVGYEYAR